MSQPTSDNPMGQPALELLNERLLSLLDRADGIASAMAEHNDRLFGSIPQVASAGSVGSGQPTAPSPMGEMGKAERLVSDLRDKLDRIHTEVLRGQIV